MSGELGVVMLYVLIAQEPYVVVKEMGTAPMEQCLAEASELNARLRTNPDLSAGGPGRGHALCKPLKPVQVAASAPVMGPPAPPAASATTEIAPVAPSGATPTMRPSSVDVASILATSAETDGRKLNWRTSVVDTMKALGLDSGRAARKRLAGKLGLEGERIGSAKANIRLRAAILAKVSENGGKLPAELTASQ